MLLDKIIEPIMNNDILMIIVIVIAGYVGFKLVNAMLKTATAILVILYLLTKLGIIF